MDVRVGGKYRLEFGRDASQTMAFYGKYLEVVPPSRLVWTNDENHEASHEGAVTTLTLVEQGGKTLLTLSDAYPTKEALDESFIGMEDAMPEQFGQLDTLLATLGAGAAR
jgi:uncharacterized protein YndB with AHSA1/START domain